MLQALGGELLDKSGKQVPFGAEGVEKLASISCKNLLPELKNAASALPVTWTTLYMGKKAAAISSAPRKAQHRRWWS